MKHSFHYLLLLALCTPILLSACATEELPINDEDPAPQEELVQPTLEPGDEEVIPVEEDLSDVVSYNVVGTYSSPAGPEEIGIQLNLVDGTVQSVSVDLKAEHPVSKGYQEQFAEGIGELAIGQPIDSLNVGIVNGSSLTPDGFNNAVEQIVAEMNAEAS